MYIPDGSESWQDLAIHRLQDNKTRQIDENRKISRRVDELEEIIKELSSKIDSICG